MVQDQALVHTVMARARACPTTQLGVSTTLKCTYPEILERESTASPWALLSQTSLEHLMRFNQLNLSLHLLSLHLAFLFHLPRAYRQPLF